MTQTVADASRSYRQRRAEKMARMEAAIDLLCKRADAVMEVSGGTVQHSDLLVAVIAARQALNPGKEMGE